MSVYVYDTGMLIAIDRNSRHAHALHLTLLRKAHRVLIPSVVIAQAWRNPRTQVGLSRLFASCQITPIDESIAKSAGALCGATKTSDIVDATVVALAAKCQGAIITSDPDDITALAGVVHDHVRPTIIVV